MTNRKAKKLFRKWKKRLNLDHWVIDLRVAKNPDYPDAVGACRKSYTEDSATIYLHPAWLKHQIRTREPRRRGDIETTIVHELIHCHFRDIQRVIKTLPLEPVVKRNIELTYNAAEELAVDRLARALTR